MGRITDAAIAIIVLVIGLWIMTRLGLTLPAIESMFHQFFFPASGSSSTNTSASAVFGVVTAAKARTRLRNRIEDRLRNRYLRGILSRFSRRSE